MASWILEDVVNRVGHKLEEEGETFDQTLIFTLWGQCSLAGRTLIILDHFRDITSECLVLAGIVVIVVCDDAFTLQCLHCSGFRKWNTFSSHFLPWWLKLRNIYGQFVDSNLKLLPFRWISNRKRPEDNRIDWKISGRVCKSSISTFMHRRIKRAAQRIARRGVENDGQLETLRSWDSRIPQRQKWCRRRTRFFDEDGWATKLWSWTAWGWRKVTEATAPISHQFKMRGTFKVWRNPTQGSQHRVQGNLRNVWILRQN